MDEAAANYLQRYLMKSFSIELLDVGYCNLTPATFAMIADGAWKCKTLKTLDMSHLMPQRNMPSIDGQKIGVIIAILVKQTNLTEVHFRNCGLGARDVEPIAEYLRESKNQLKHLDLGSNHIGPGVKCLMEAISENSFSNLVDFDCSRNSLGHLGGEEIARNLYNTNLRYLDISHNEIPAPVMESILKVIDKPKPLHILNIFGNTFDATVARALKRKIDAEILLKDCVDVRVVPEAQNFRVIHQNNLKAPFYRAHESFEIATDKF